MEALSSLGIDINGLILHLVNFGILLAILLKFFYKPIMTFIDERRDTIRQNLEEAETLRKKFATVNDAREAEKERTVREMQKELAEAKSFAETKSRELIAEAETRKEELIDEARVVIEEMKNRLQKEVEADVKARMEKVILHVLANDVPEETVKKSVESAWSELEAKA